MMTGNGVMHNGTTILDEYGHNLDRLKVSNVFLALSCRCVTLCLPPSSLNASVPSYRRVTR